MQIRLHTNKWLRLNFKDLLLNSIYIDIKFFELRLNLSTSIFYIYWYAENSK